MALRLTAALRLVARVVLAAALVAQAAKAQIPRASEYAVKAAFLYQFTRFVRWPDSAFAAPDAPFRICVWGSDPFGADLARVAGSRQGQHAIRVERPSSAEALLDCQLVYVSDDAPLGVASTLDLLAGRSVLTVSSAPGFVDAGGALEFVIRDSRVRMVVNAGTMRQGGLAASAKLLEVADRVVGQAEARQ